MSEDKHVFVGNVMHDGESFLKGQLVPEKHVAEMLKKELAVALPKPVAPVAAPEPKAKAKAEK